MTDVSLVETREEEALVERTRRLVVNPYVRVVRCSDDEVVAKHGTRSLFSEVISDAGRRHLLGRLLDRLRRPASVDELLAEGFVAAEDVAPLEDAVAYLERRHVLVPADRERLSLYFDTFLGRADGLAETAVGVAGGGELARRVAARLEELRPAALFALDDEATAEAALPRLFSEADAVVVALDAWSPRLLHVANGAALAARKPWHATFFDGHELVVGPTFVPGETCCYAEFELQAEASLVVRNEALLLQESLFEQPLGETFLLPPHVDVAAGFTVDAIVRLLLAGTSYTVGRAVRIDLERASIDYQDVLTLPRCPACQATRGARRHVFV